MYEGTEDNDINFNRHLWPVANIQHIEINEVKKALIGCAIDKAPAYDYLSGACLKKYRYYYKNNKVLTKKYETDPDVMEK